MADEKTGELRSSSTTAWFSTIPKPSPDLPVKVHWKVYFNELYGVDSVSQQSTMSLFFAVYWKDDRIIMRDPEVPEEDAWNSYTFKDGVDPEEIWTPHIELVNAGDGGSVDEEAREVVCIPGEGPYIIQHNTFKGPVSTPMDLKQFPFDRQILPIKFRSSLYPEEDCELWASEADQKSMLQCLDARFASTEFYIRELKAKQDTVLYPMLAEIEGETRATYCEYRLEFLVERKPAYYMHKVWLQFNFIAVMDFFCAMLLEFDIGNRNTVALTLFLTAVALSFAVAGDLPKISYRTRMDTFIIMNYLVMFVVFMSNFFVYFWYDQNPDTPTWEDVPNKIEIGFGVVILTTWFFSNLWFVLPLFFLGKKNDENLNPNLAQLIGMKVQEKREERKGVKSTSRPTSRSIALDAGKGSAGTVIGKPSAVEE
eukprot:TRINITY_DN7013_c0_g1_i1.p1 TRINITY_DN7013_c0_g1~~TRINITY_DN7013_c0_g1_i1.p1  ORF type:complete len:425 (-),score=126.02 TRINITY_DN7013_c0_g1_i1:114-1388(-)